MPPPSELECPFCNSVFMSISYNKSVKMRHCTNRKCGRQFFYFRGKYYVAMGDVPKLRKKTVYDILIGRKN